MSELFCRLIKKRGLDEDFLKPKYDQLSDPFLLPDMKKAVKRLLLARDRQEKVLIYGDYDVDGVTASTIMFDILRLLRVEQVEVMLPDRFTDGYGMGGKVVERAKSEDFSLVVTVDCGNNNGEVISELKKVGVDVVVTDHHEVSDGVPRDAVAVVRSLELCGAGVAFMVARALVVSGEIPDGAEKWLLDLAMIGTVCDSMKMVGDNRIISKYGLLVLEKTRRVGLIELMRQAGVKELNTETVGFIIGPRLNAAGRMDNAETALKLLLARSKPEAAALSLELEELNNKRRLQQKTALKEIVVDEKAEVILAVGEWHEGIIGIVAGRLMEEYEKPAFVFTKLAGDLKGSGRSFGDFSLAEALRNCPEELLISGGGHAGACGVRIAEKNFLEFSNFIKQYYKGLKLKNQQRFLKQSADIAVENVAELSLDFLDELRELEPFGEGNLEPLFLLKNMVILEVNQMGEEKNHLRLVVKDKDGKVFKLVKFFAPKEWFLYCPGDNIEVLVKLERHEWKGLFSVEGKIVDLKMVEENF